MIKFQQSQALTSHFESFWSIVLPMNWLTFSVSSLGCFSCISVFVRFLTWSTWGWNLRWELRDILLYKSRLKVEKSMQKHEIFLLRYLASSNYGYFNEFQILLWHRYYYLEFEMRKLLPLKNCEKWIANLCTCLFASQALKSDNSISRLIYLFLFTFYTIKNFITWDSL